MSKLYRFEWCARAAGHIDEAIYQLQRARGLPHDAALAKSHLKTSVAKITRAIKALDASRKAKQ